MAIPLIPLAVLGLLALGSGCAPTRSSRRTESGEEDLCPDMEECVCSERTGVLPGRLRYEGDHFVWIGRERIDRRKDLYTQKFLGPLRLFGRRLFFTQTVTYPPQKRFQFKLGSAEPKNYSAFRKKVRHLTGKLFDLMIGKYRCVKKRFSDDLVIYVSGHTDRLGNEEQNRVLSEARARRVAGEINQWLLEHRSQLIQPIRIEIIGMGETMEAQKGRSPNHKNPNARKVDVIVQTDGKPFDGVWKISSTVYPGKDLPDTPFPPPSKEPQGDIIGW